MKSRLLSATLAISLALSPITALGQNNWHGGGWGWRGGPAWGWHGGWGWRGGGCWGCGLGIAGGVIAGAALAGALAYPWYYPPPAYYVPPPAYYPPPGYYPPAGAAPYWMYQGQYQAPYPGPYSGQ